MTLCWTGLPGGRPGGGRRWSERWQQYGFGPPDPREGSDALRYDSYCGLLQLRLAHELPECVGVRLGERTVQVLPVSEIETDDPASARVLERMRQRLASRP